MTIFKTLHRDYIQPNREKLVRHFDLHRKAEAWAKEHNIKITRGEVYVSADVYELETEEDALAFTLMFGELM